MCLGSSINPPWESWEWPKVFATSPYASPRGYLICRSALAVIFLAHLLAHMIDRLADDGLYYFIYLSHWSFVLETVNMVQLLICDVLSMGALTARQYENRKGYIRPSMRAAMVIFCVAQPLSLLATVSYWTLENPVWKVTHKDLPDYLGFFVHGVDSVLMLVSLMISRVPYTWQNAGWLLVTGVAYLVWTLIHFELRIGTLGGCTEYIRPECPLYEVLDWHKPKEARLAAAVFLLVVIPSAMAFCKLLVIFRDLFDERTDLVEMDQSHRQETESLKAREDEEKGVKDLEDFRPRDREAPSDEKGFCLRCVPSRWAPADTWRTQLPWRFNSGATDF